MSPALGRPFDDVPNGFQHRQGFVSSDAERALVEHLARVEFSRFEMRGVVARRRVAFFGSSYDASGPQFTPPLPAFLLPLRDKVAQWAGVQAEAFAMAQINEYPPGAPIGWHRDAPQYDIVAGISLLSACCMKFRPYVRPRAQASTGAQRRTATHQNHARAAVRVLGGCCVIQATF